MNNSKLLLKRPLNRASTASVVAILVIAILGFADSAFLTIEHYRGVVPPCTTAGCDIVLTSVFSAIWGMPVALLGAVYYLLIALGAFIFLEAKHIGKAAESHHFSILKWTLLATILGLLMSLWFTYVQIFILGSYCLYCLGSALTSVLLFVFALNILIKNENI